MYGVFLSLMLIWSLKTHMVASIVTGTQPQVPCLFVFGDSLSDYGNNNQLITTAKANYFPYGIDFPPGRNSTGRFSNGFNIIDIISKLLGFVQYILSFSDANASLQIDVSLGVNYASGGAGIRSETGYQLGERIPLDVQLLNHNIIVARLALKKGNETSNYLGKCLYIANIGSNDYINNYFAPQGYVTNITYTPEQYAAALIVQYSQQLRTLYYKGARKIAVFTVGALGCTPAEIQQYGKSSGSSCVDKINNAVQLFNKKLRPLVAQLNSQLPGASVVLVDLSSVSLTATQGFTVFDESCCVVNPSDGMCEEGVEPCPDRSAYIFYDNFHPTQAVNMLTGSAAYSQIVSLLS